MKKLNVVSQNSTLFLLLALLPFLSFNVFAQIDNNFSAGGGIKIGDSTSTCDGTTEGALRYDQDSAKTIDYCNGTGWLTLLTSSVSGTSIEDADGNTKIQVEEGANDDTIRFDTAGTERMVISSSGNVGIGTPAPAVNLHVQNDVDSFTLLRVENDSAGTNAFVGFELVNDIDVSAIYLPGSNLPDPSIANKLAILTGSDNSGLLMLTQGSDPIEFGTSNTNRMIIDSAGNVGVGTATPGTNFHVYRGAAGQVARFESSALAQLQVKATSNDSELVLRSDTISWGIANDDSNSNSLRFTREGSDYMTIGSTGNVGIGTAAPAVELDVHTGTINAAQICDENNANCQDLSSGGDADNLGDHTATQDLDMSANEILGLSLGTVSAPSLSFAGGDTNTGIWSPAGDSMAMSTAGNEAMRIDAAGNVGIGTTSPQGLAHLSSNGDVDFIIEADADNVLEDDNPRLILKQDGGLVNGSIGLSQNAADGQYVGQTGNSLYIQSHNNAAGDIQFVTGATTLGATNGVARMTILHGGNIGVGTTAPAVELDVHTGTINAAQICDENNANCQDLSSGGGADNLGDHTATQDLDMSANEILGLSLGTVSAPSLSFAGGDTNTGIWSPAGDSMAISTAGNEAMRIDAAGNVGIGTAAPTRPLHVTGDVYFGNGTDGFFFNIVDEKIVSDSTVGNFVDLYTGSGADIEISANTDMFLTAGWGATGFHVLNGDGVGIGDQNPDAHLEISADGTTGGAVLMVSSDDGNDGDLLTILESGLVGIGTDSPSTKLHVSGGNMTLSSGNMVVDSGQQIDFDGVSGGAWSLGRNSAGFTKSIVSGNTLDISISNTTNEGLAIGGAGNSIAEFKVSGESFFRGNVGIGSTSPSVELDVVGDIQYTGTISDVSDRRFKENIQPLESSLEVISQVRGVSFEMIDDPDDEIEFGVIAQEVEKVLPELVRTANNERKTKSVNYIGFIAWLIEAVKELTNLNSDLENRVNQLESKIEITNAQNKNLEERVNSGEARLRELESRLNHFLNTNKNN